MQWLTQTSNRNDNLAAVNCTAAFILNFRDVIKEKTIVIHLSDVWFFPLISICSSDFGLSPSESPCNAFAFSRFTLHWCCSTVMPTRKENFSSCVLLHKAGTQSTVHQDSWPTHKHPEFVFQQEIISSPSYKKKSIGSKWRNRLAWNSRIQQTNKHKGKSDLSN